MFEKIKEVLDQECYLNWKAKQCQQRGEFYRKFGSGNPCWLCHRNEPLVQKILDAVEQKVSR